MITSCWAQIRDAPIDYISQMLVSGCCGPCWLISAIKNVWCANHISVLLAYCSSIVWWSVERLQVQLCLFIVKISLLPWNRRWNKYIRICQSAQKLTISASLPHASFYYWCRPCSIYHVVLHDWKGDSSHFEADILLVLGPQCMIWPETSTTSFICLCGLFWGADSYLI